MVKTNMVKKVSCQTVKNYTKAGSIQLLTVCNEKIGKKPSFRRTGNVKLQQDGTYKIATFARLGQATLNKLLLGGFVRPEGIPETVCYNCNECKNFCYNLKLFWRSCVLKNRVSNYLWTVSKEFVELSIKELTTFSNWASKKGKKAAVRIHVEGEFTDLEYFTKWCDIATATPQTKFYSYTKNYELLLNNWTLLPINLNIMVSSWTGQSQQEVDQINELVKIGFKVYHARAKDEELKGNFVNCNYDCSNCCNCIEGKGNASITIH